MLPASTPVLEPVWSHPQGSEPAWGFSGPAGALARHRGRAPTSRTGLSRPRGRRHSPGGGGCKALVLGLRSGRKGDLTSWLVDM